MNTQFAAAMSIITSSTLTFAQINGFTKNDKKNKDKDILLIETELAAMCSSMKYDSVGSLARILEVVMKKDYGEIHLAKFVEKTNGFHFVRGAALVVLPEFEYSAVNVGDIILCKHAEMSHFIHVNSESRVEAINVGKIRKNTIRPASESEIELFLRSVSNSDLSYMVSQIDTNGTVVDAISSYVFDGTGALPECENPVETSAAYVDWGADDGDEVEPGDEDDEDEECEDGMPSGVVSEQTREQISRGYGIVNLTF